MRSASHTWRGVPLTKLQTAVSDHIITGFRHVNLDIVKYDAARKGLRRSRSVNDAEEAIPLAEGQGTRLNSLILERPMSSDAFANPFQDDLIVDSHDSRDEPSTSGEMQMDMKHEDIEPSTSNFFTAAYSTTSPTSPSTCFSSGSSLCKWDAHTPISPPELSPVVPASDTNGLDEQHQLATASQETIKAPMAALSIGALAFERVEEESSGRASSELGDFGLLSPESSERETLSMLRT